MSERHKTEILKSFDSYIEDGKLYIFSLDRNGFGELEPTHHEVSIDRAKQIARDLHSNILRYINK